MPVVLTLWTVGQEGPCEFKASLITQCDPVQSMLHSQACLQIKNKQINKKGIVLFDVDVFPLQINYIKLKRRQAGPL